MEKVTARVLLDRTLAAVRVVVKSVAAVVTEECEGGDDIDDAVTEDLQTALRKLVETRAIVIDVTGRL